MAVSAASSNVRTFRVASPVRALTPAVVACVFAFVVVFAVTPPEDRGVLVFLAAVLLFSLGFGAWLLSRTRLDVSPDGITYYAIGYRVHSTWANLKGYGKRSMRSASYESLILNEPGIEVDRWMRVGMAFMPVAQVAGAAHGRLIVPVNLARYADFIPVALFSADWQNDDLGRLIRKYAPQVFDHPMTQ